MLENYTNEQKENEAKIKSLTSNAVEEMDTQSDLQEKVKKFFKNLNTLVTKEELTFQEIQSFIDKAFISGSKKNLEISFIYNNVNLFIEEFKCNVLNQ